MNGRSTQEKTGLGPGSFRATNQQLGIDHIAKQALSGIQARLSCAGGQIVSIASDGAFVVVSPFAHTTRFSNLSALQAYADGVRV